MTSGKGFANDMQVAASDTSITVAALEPDVVRRGRACVARIAKADHVEGILAKLGIEKEPES